MKNLEKVIGIAMLVIAVGFNLWLYRLEPTAKVDPNDNLFQYALVYRTNQIWDYAQKTSPANFLMLFDHWVPNWNEGFNLPYYYSHVPQIVIVGTWKIFQSTIELFAYYHLVIYLLLCFFPLSVFLALRVMGQSWRTAGFGALLASQLSTDGLYGLDPPSFLWRGYGLSSQLFAMLFFPLAIAFAYRLFKEADVRKRTLSLAALFLILTTAGHLGIGILAFMSLVPLAILPLKNWRSNFIKLVLLAGISIFFLSYWIVPAMLNDKFHAFSFWDPVWKFNSYGARITIGRLFNGELFDFGRLPIFTALVLIGIYAAIENGLYGLALLFIFWFLLYFGRTTWGSLIDLIPAMKEFHLSRYIVGVHISGLFLAPIGLSWLTTKITKSFRAVAVLFALLLLIPIYQQTISYNTLNESLINRANGNFARQSPAVDALVSTLRNLEKEDPGRVFAGRGGGWGKDFRIAETNLTMYLGNFAIPTVLWLPETWSPNGDTEQYFSENLQKDYDLFNIKYVATPPDLTKENIQPFWRLIKENPGWKLYKVETSGYFEAGVVPTIVSADKYNRTNVVRLWIQSDDPKKGLYPQLTFDTKHYPINSGLPNFRMLDDVTYQIPAGSTHNLFAENPKYMSSVSPASLITISSQSDTEDMIFKANVTVKSGCTNCIVVLKQSFHPNWKLTMDGKPIIPIITFPFYIGIPVAGGTHTIAASYEPSGLKIFLLIVSGITVIGGIIYWRMRLR